MEATIISLQTKHVGNDNQHMTSLEIAEVTGKQHFHVMEAIRKMEPAWEKICKSKFRLTSRIVEQPNGGTRVHSGVHSGTDPIVHLIENGELIIENYERKSGK